MQTVGDLVRSTTGAWMVRAPEHGARGHDLCPGEVLVVHQACLGRGGGHTTWTCRTCDQTVYGPPLNTHCTTLPTSSPRGRRRGEQQREPRQPALEEHVDRAGAETVADPLQRFGILAGGESVGQLGELQTRLGGVAFGPFVSVDPDLDRPRVVGADLDEGRSEIGVAG